MSLGRRIALGAALAATLGAALWEAPEEDPVERGAPRRAAAPAAPEAERSLRPPYAAQAANLFPSRTWQPPPPPLPRAQAPEAPPLPFRYLGKMLEGETTLVFLAQGARTHLVRAGDTVAGYRVEEVTPAGMTLVYLPLNEPQRMTFGSAN